MLNLDLVQKLNVLLPMIKVQQNLFMAYIYMSRSTQHINTQVLFVLCSKHMLIKSLLTICILLLIICTTIYSDILVKVYFVN